jgi:hypothetical protein
MEHANIDNEDAQEQQAIAAAALSQLSKDVSN